MSCEGCERRKRLVERLREKVAGLQDDVSTLEDEKDDSYLESFEDTQEQLTAAAAIVHRLHNTKDICLCAICEWHRRH